MSLQVLERQKAPDYSGIAESFQKGRELAADIVYKKGLVDYNKELLKMKAKEAESEAEKAKYEKMVKRWEVASKVIDYGKSVAQETVNGVTRINQEKWEKYITTVIVNNPELAEVFGSDELRKMTPSIEAKERLEGSAASLIERELGGGQQFPGAAPVQNGETGGVEPTNQGRIGAVGGGLVTGINAGPVNIAFPGAQSELARQNAIATKEGALSVPERLPAATLDKFQEGTAATMRANNTISSALNNPDFKSYMGIPGGPKRAGAKYLLGERGQKYSAFAAESKEMVNIYRKMITGAQASVQELDRYIKTVLGDPESDTYETFLLKNMVATYTALGNVNQQIRLYKGYDVSPLQDMATQLTAQAEGINNRLKTQVGLDVDSLISSLPVDKEGKEIAQLLIAAGNAGRPISYEVAKKVVRGK